MCDDFRQRVSEARVYILDNSSNKDSASAVIMMMRKYIYREMHRSMIESDDVFRTARSWVGYYGWTYANSKVRNPDAIISKTVYIAMKSILKQLEQLEDVSLPVMNISLAVRLYRRECELHSFDASELRMESDPLSAVERLMFGTLARLVIS